MKPDKTKKNFAIIGGGPSGLFMYKRLVEGGHAGIAITVFEKTNHLGAGMPYSPDGAGPEHVTNVSGNEIPTLVTSVEDWLNAVPPELLKPYNITPENYNDYKVLPRLLFGHYLTAQFDLLQAAAKKRGMATTVHTHTAITDIADNPGQNNVTVSTASGTQQTFDAVIICTGHCWPHRQEGTVPGYFNSPYPPAKLALKANHPVAIKGSSLTAIDAVRTLARHNGAFTPTTTGCVYTLAEGSENFKLVMHSRNGLLPAFRFHLADTHLSKDAALSAADVRQLMAGNAGFVPLDVLFSRVFKASFQHCDPAFYEEIKHLRIEEFVAKMMSLREQLDPFVLFRAEYAEAEKSMRRRESVYWKEALAVLSFAMNYPAKHLSAEDMLRLQKVLMPLISVVIAFVPQSSGLELMALHQAGVLSLIAVGADSSVTPEAGGGATYCYTNEAGEPQSVYYPLFVDSTGQPHLPYHDFPFKSLLADKTISAARLRFKEVRQAKEAMKDDSLKIEQATDGSCHLQVPGIAINDSFQVTDAYGAYNPRIYMMAVPYIGGFNPDYSGLDFCEAASGLIANRIFEEA